MKHLKKFNEGFMDLFKSKNPTDGYKSRSKEQNDQYNDQLNAKVNDAKEEAMYKFKNDPDYLKLKKDIMNGNFRNASIDPAYTYSTREPRQFGHSVDVPRQSRNVVIKIVFDDGSVCQIHQDIYLNNFGDTSSHDGIIAHVLSFSNWGDKNVLEVFDKLDWNLPSITQTWDKFFKKDDTIIISDADFKMIKSAVE